MDRLLLNPRVVMADVNGNSKITNAELEVKKLQELVRKLEKQNEQLRTRANAANNCSSGGRLLAAPPAACPAFSLGPDSYSTGNYGLSPFYYASFGLSDEQHSTYLQCRPVSGAEEEKHEQDSVLDDVEVLHLPSLLPVDAESDYTWLYVSPKAKLFGHPLLNTIQWCRHVLDNSQVELNLAKQSLCYKLIQGPASTKHQKAIQRRSCSSLTERSPTFLYHTNTHGKSHCRQSLSPQSSVDSEINVSELEKDSISMCYKLQDMTDVEVMARLQEESLRQEYASSAATSTRRSASFSLHSSAMRDRRSNVELEDEGEEEDDEYYQLSTTQQRLFGTALQRSVSHTQNLSSLRECRRSPSTPQYLHAPRHISSIPEAQRYKASTDKLRRSMPNLLRSPSITNIVALPNVSPANGHMVTPSSSLSLLRNSQSFDSHNGLSNMQSGIPSPGHLMQRVQSMGSFTMMASPPLKAMAYVSPTIQSTSTPPPQSSSGNVSCVTSKSSTPLSSRSSLPRPASFVVMSGGSRSKISQPARSLLTAPKSGSALSTLRDGSWRDGCY